MKRNHPIAAALLRRVESIVRGANGAALGMLAAWTMRDVLGRRAYVGMSVSF